MPSRSQNRLFGQGSFSGVLLIVLGTAFLLDHLGIIRFDHLIRFWPVLIILVGVMKIVNEVDYLFGILAILVGAFFLSHTLGIAELSWGAVWPVALILVGFFLLLNRFPIRNMPNFPNFPNVTGPRPIPGGDMRNTVHDYALFGGVERRVSVPDFRGGTINATFGGVELDLRGSDIEGEEAHIFIDATFGGVELKVPERWEVIFQGLNLFGGYNDETRSPAPNPTNPTPRKRLIIEGRAMFGGITIKN